MRTLLFTAACSALLAAPTAAAVDIGWVTVRDAGNAPDTTGFGAVAYEYRIAKHEVTNAQYAEFLNAVAATDIKALYDTNMANPLPVFNGHGGITRKGFSGSFSYSAIVGRESMPVNWVSFWDGLRFANWLHNGQPTGAQGTATTEDGAYTMTVLGIAHNSITRNPGATIFLPSEDEWYKPAYYDAVSTYFDYPTGTDVLTVCAPPGGTANTANCGSVVGDLTAIGSYTGSASPNGTFDQGGNVWEWNEAIISTFNRGLRGGEFSIDPDNFAAANRSKVSPVHERSHVGFRVASLPGPSLDCSETAAVPDEIWPPDHKFQDVVVEGVTSPVGEPVVITITTVVQDEPLEGAGDGNTCPDAGGIETDIAIVRAERSGSGDGRVYHIGFTADDGESAQCRGIVTVCVPHDEDQAGTCGDGGPIFDSTMCGGDLAAAASAAGFGRSCGIGFELAFLMPLLTWLHRSRRRRN